MKYKKKDISLNSRNQQCVIRFFSYENKNTRVYGSRIYLDALIETHCSSSLNATVRVKDSSILMTMMITYFIQHHLLLRNRSHFTLRNTKLASSNPARRF